MPKPRRSIATVVHSTPNPGGSPRPSGRRPGTQARRDERPSDMGHSRGQRSTQVKSGPEAHRVGADEGCGQAVAGRTSTACRPLGPSFNSNSTGCPSSRLR